MISPPKINNKRSRSFENKGREIKRHRSLSPKLIKSRKCLKIKRRKCISPTPKRKGTKMMLPILPFGTQSLYTNTRRNQEYHYINSKISLC